MSKTTKLLVVGMPQVGKTTFLAALWHVLVSREVNSALMLDSLQPSRGHLNAITKLWREWKKLPRTTMSKERSLTINLRISGSEQVYQLEVPDASGDAFRRMFETRRCRSEFAELANEASGVLLFVNPRNAVPPQPIDATVAAMANPIDNGLEQTPTSSAFHKVEQGATIQLSPNAAALIASEMQDAPPEGILSWEPKHASYQSQLLDLLQIIAHIRGGRPQRLAIIISAWDLCAIEDLTPHQWLKLRLPLLYQYLEANRDQQSFQIFGISAQGAELNEPGVLLDVIRASDRISVVSAKEPSHDITIPIHFLLNGAGGCS